MTIMLLSCDGMLMESNETQLKTHQNIPCGVELYLIDLSLFKFTKLLLLSDLFG